MAKQVITRTDLLLASQLAEAGIPVHEEALEKMRVACYRTERRHLMISQYGGECDRAFVIPGRGTGYVVYTKMANDRGGMVALCDVALRLPWADRYFEWLGDPEELYRRKSYRFQNDLDYPKNEVINHFVFGRRRLRYSDFIEGALLGFSAVRIPDCFPHGCLLEAELIVTDQLDIKYCYDVTLYVDRSAELIHKKHEPRRKREKLFDESEDLGEASAVLARGTT
jgi:hypothetical protein